MKQLVLVTVLLAAFQTIGQQLWQPDILGNSFEQQTILQPNDYEGKVTCTIIRKRTATQPRKAVLYIHGFNDYFFQAEMADWYIAHGYDFYAVDLRKYGRSILPNQKMNNVRDLKEYFADIDTALRIMQHEGCEEVLLSGHSAGGLITTYYAQQHPNSPLFDALFLNSPFFDFNVSQFLKKFGVPMVAKKGLKKPDKLKKAGLSPLYGESLHRSALGEWDYNLAWKPLAPPPVNYGWIRAVYVAQEAVRNCEQPVTVPVLVICCPFSVKKPTPETVFDGDLVLDVDDIREGWKRLKVSGVKEIDEALGLIHDVFLSPKKARDMAYSNLGEWLSKNLPAPTR